MGYKNKIRLEIYKEVLRIINEPFMDANAIIRLDYIKKQIERKIRRLENEIL